MSAYTREMLGHDGLLQALLYRAIVRLVSSFPNRCRATGAHSRCLSLGATKTPDDPSCCNHVCSLKCMKLCRSRGRASQAGYLNRCSSCKAKVIVVLIMQRSLSFLQPICCRTQQHQQLTRQQFPCNSYCHWGSVSLCASGMA
jgi:hypothetical protein